MSLTSWSTKPLTVSRSLKWRSNWFDSSKADTAVCRLFSCPYWGVESVVDVRGQDSVKTSLPVVFRHQYIIYWMYYIQIWEKSWHVGDIVMTIYWQSAICKNQKPFRCCYTSDCRKASAGRGLNINGEKNEHLAVLRRFYILYGYVNPILCGLISSDG